MLSQLKWARVATAVLVVLALVSGSAWAKKPPKDPPPNPPPVTYMITWLDAFSYSEVEGLNSQGGVVGHAMSPDRYEGGPFAFLYTPEDGMVDLNTLLPEGSGWFLKTTRDINDQGQIVGYGYLNENDTPRAYRYTPALRDAAGTASVPAMIEPIGPLEINDQHSVASSINERGEVCGYTQDSNAVDHVWFYSDEIGIVPVMSGNGDYPTLRPRKINESTQILVWGQATIDLPQFAARVIPFNEPEYFYPDGGGYLDVQDMNDSGHFVSQASIEVPFNKKRTTIELRALRHDGNDFFDLGAGHGSAAFGINNSGDVVGVLPIGSDSMRRPGFVYLESSQQLFSLEDAVVGSADDVALWIDTNTSQFARYINDAGVITGDGYGVGLGFVLTPNADGGDAFMAKYLAVVPEPSTGLLLMLGLAAMLFRRDVVVS